MHEGGRVGERVVPEVLGKTGKVRSSGRQNEGGRQGGWVF